MTLAKLLESRSYIIPGRLKISELFFEVPIDHSDLSGDSIRLFARSVRRLEQQARKSPGELYRENGQKPWFVYLQGGPGFGCPLPQNLGITNTILDKGYQMLYVDQRGTGLSSPITAQTLALRGDIEKQFEYLKFFRADSIVKDCEAIRKTLTEDYSDDLKKWSIMGQSYGGFCVFTYLSKHPEGLREAFTSGGIPPISHSPDQVYEATYARVIERNKAYYHKFPEDVKAVRTLAHHIKSELGLQLPSGTLLTVRLFLTLGRGFGFHGGLDTVHNLILRMTNDLTQFKFITRPTLSALENSLSFDNTVLYALLHEAIYCENRASNWAAERVGKNLKEFHWLSEYPARTHNSDESPLYFSGEMIYPFLFNVSPELMKLSAIAEKVALHEDWPNLYDQDQLSNNLVPLYALTFIDDMYVDFKLAQRTVHLVKNCKQHITNKMYHDAISSKSQDVVKELFALRDDSLD